MSKPKTTAKGKHGGKRPGAGRPKGADNALPYGAVQALRSLNHRLPASVSEEAKALSERCTARIVDVLEERVGFQEAGHVLKAATILREEICGPLKQRVEHSFEAMTDEQLEARYRALVASGSASGTPPPESGE